MMESGESHVMAHKAYIGVMMGLLHVLLLLTRILTITLKYRLDAQSKTSKHVNGFVTYCICNVC